MSKLSTNENNETKQTSLIASRLQDISNEFDKFVGSEHQTESSEMKHIKQVRKRDGTLQPVSFDKIRDRIMNLSDDLNVDSTELSQEVISCLYDGMETKELDELAARKAHNRCFIHPDWDRLASRISISNHHKETSGVFSEVIFELYENDLVCKEVVDFVKKYETRLNDVIDYKRDYALDYTGFQYFLKIYADRTIEYDENGSEIQGPIIERFQDLLMKVSLGIHRGGFDIDSAIETYQFYSCLLFTHASPTIFNAAKTKSQCSSCFLLAMKEEPEWPYDSITKIYETLSDCAKISKLAGGIGVSISNVRGKGTIIHSVGRPSSGIVPMCKVYNETARYVDQGRRRKGAFALYAEPWHPDIIDFLQLKKDDGVSEDLRAKDLFYAMWVPDLFMKRVEADEMWSLIDPSVCPELYKTNSDEFEEHYLRCEREKKYVRQMPAKELYYEIIVAQIETGTPYMCFKDHANRKSNQKNLGTIRQSNLCVSGDTRILTDSGYKEIISLKDQKVNIWNGFEWSETSVKQTGTNQELMKIEFSNGATLKCTPHHKFYINTNRYSCADKTAFQNKSKTKLVEAKELTIGQKLIKHDFPIIRDNNSESFVEPYTHGFFCGDGTVSNQLNEVTKCSYKSDNSGYCQRHQYFNDEGQDIILNDGICKAKVGEGAPQIYLYGEKKLLKDKLSFRNDYINNDHIVLQLNPHIAKKFTVPINCSINDKMLWLSGLSDADGTVARNEDNESLQISSIHRDFLNDIRLMLSEIGIHSKVTLSRMSSDRMMPDGKGGSKLYKCQPLYRLLVSSWELMNLFKLGFNTHRLKFTKKEPQRNARQFVKVANIEFLTEPENTYCFTEHKLGLGTFEGIVTGQCAEITEYTDSEQQAVCFTADTDIITRNGIKKITECDGEDVLSMFSDESCSNEMQHFEKARLVENGMKEVYEITIEGHGTIKATGEHPILVRTKRNTNTKTNTYIWKKVKDLRKDDNTVVPSNSPLPGYDIDIMKNQDVEMQTGGWILGDGWLSEQGWGVCFGPQEKETSEIVIQQMNKWQQSSKAEKCGHDKPVKTYVQPNGVINWQSSKKKFKELLTEKFGFERTLGKHKYLPETMKRKTPIQLANFLSGYFSADGCICRAEKNNKQKVVVQLSSASEELLLDCQKALKLFGIHSRVRFGEVKTRPGRFQGTLAIHGLENLKRFQKSINFVLSPEKEVKLNLFIDEFKTLYSRDSTVAKVKDIVKCELYEKVYDLVLPNSHNFIANNIVVHNCNLASICLPRYIDTDGEGKNPTFNHDLLHEATKILTRNLNKVIDINYYPNDETKRSNFLHRPIGIGIQGLADTFYKMGYPFESEEAAKLNSEISETIYFAALEASCELAEEEGAYESYEGSPMSKGIFQFDLWNDSSVSDRWNWTELKENIAVHGIRNSLLVALMPTASTSFLMGCCESFEPISSNYYVSGGIVGPFKRVNKYLIHEMIERELWTNEMRNLIVANNGSVQNIGLPEDIEKLYKTVWEIPQKVLIDLSAERGRFTCQSQSFNVYLLGGKESQSGKGQLDQSIVSKLSSLHMYTWKKGLKTGMYYLRTKPAKDPIKTTIDPKMMKEREQVNRIKDVDKLDDADLEEQAAICRRDNKEDCMMCGS